MIDSDREKRIKVEAAIRQAGPKYGLPPYMARRMAEEALDALGPVVPLERAQELENLVAEFERERDEARALLRRLDEWDQIRSTAPGCDGPYWRREIAAVLGSSFLPPDSSQPQTEGAAMPNTATKPRALPDYYQIQIRLSHRFHTFDDAQAGLDRAAQALRQAGFEIDYDQNTGPKGEWVGEQQNFAG